MGSTKVELVNDLREKEPSGARDKLIERALKGVYHDFDSDIAMPKVTLHRALVDAGYPDLAAKVVDGAYDDESPTVEQAEELRQEVGADFFDALMGGKERNRA